jgi:hypothetical protein
MITTSHRHMPRSHRKPDATTCLRSSILRPARTGLPPDLP